MSKVPKYFEDFLENDYKHLKEDVGEIKKDIGKIKRDQNYWIKPLLLLILSAIVIGAIAIIAG